MAIMLKSHSSRARRPNRPADSGAAMVMSAIVATVVLALGSVMLSFADRENSSSNNDRMRQHAIDAAMAGTVVANAALASNSAYAGTEATDFEGEAQYRVVVTTDATVGGFRRIITSYGSAPHGDNPVAVRVVRQVVELDPVTFEYGVFAGGNYGDGSASTVIGGIYTGGNINLGNAHDYMGDIYSRGNIVTGSNQKVTGNLHASGNVLVTNNSTTVYGNVYAGGNISTGGTIRDAAQAGGSIGCAKVQGACMPYSPPPPVPVQQLTVFTWNPANYPSVTELTGAQLVTAAKNTVHGVFHVNGDVAFAKNDNLRMSGDVTIVATGNLSLPGKITNVANGSNLQLTVVAFGNVTVANNLTIPSTITSLVYTKGSFDGKNSSAFSGVIYAAGNISLGANSLITQAPVSAPGFDWTNANPQRFTIRNVSTREITAGTQA